MYAHVLMRSSIFTHCRSDKVVTGDTEEELLLLQAAGCCPIAPFLLDLDLEHVRTKREGVSVDLLLPFPAI